MRLLRREHRSLEVTDNTVIYDREGSIATLELNRPQSINAVSQSMRDLMFDAVTAYSYDSDALACIIFGRGEKGFCAGADLIEFGKSRSQSESRSARKRRDLWGLLANIKKPLIAAVHGYVIGAGLEITSLCDIRIASEDAQFGMPEVAIGMIPGAGGTQSFPRAIGINHAMRQFLTHRNDRMSAQKALKLGLIHMIVPKEHLFETAKRVAAEITLAGKDALTAVKTAVLEGLSQPLALGIEMEQRLTSRLYVNIDR